MLQAALHIILLLGSPLIVSTALPDQLHCSTTVYWQNKPDQGSSASAAGPPVRPANLYQVEEYVDLDSRRSSISIVDTTDKAKIYYNRAGPDEHSHRSFTLYDPLTKECSDGKMYSWPLVLIATFAMRLYKSNSDVKFEHVDVANGPSSLLYAIENNLSGFVFKSRIFSKSKQTNVDVFGRTLKYGISAGSENVDVIVHLITRGRARPKEGETLEKVYGRDGSMHIALVGACRTGGFDNLDSVGPQSKASENGNRGEGKHEHIIDLQLDEDAFCPREKLVFTIHYHIVSLHRQATLVGKSLDDFGQDTGYNFRLEPFAMPVGIGCLADYECSRRAWEKNLSDRELAKRFSAEYVSLYGDPGVSYVAFDEQRRLLRLDGAGRKNIYDIGQIRAYSIAESPASDQTIGRSDGGNDGKEVPQCITFAMELRKSPIQYDADLRPQVIGLERRDNERYLGSRMLDHVNYEVFEKEWTDKSKLPLVLRSSKFPSLMSTANKRLFITYYARNESTISRSDSVAGESDKQDDHVTDEPLLLSFIEVWQFDTVQRTRRLMNRVKFLEFSWQLDIEPADDAQSQRPGSVDMRVFQVEPCLRERAAQAELVVAFRRGTWDGTGSTWLNASKDGQLLASSADYYLANVLDVSILNLVDTKARVLESGDVIASTRVVELRTSVSTSHSLGLLKYQPGDLAGDLERIVSSIHSHHECLIEAIKAAGSTWFAHCPNLAFCLILKEKQQLKGKFLITEAQKDELLTEQKQERSSSQDGVKWDACTVESNDYKTVDVTRTYWNSGALQRAFDFHTDTRAGVVERNYGLGSGSYKVEAVAFKNLDPIGFRLTNDVSLLSGLRYSTKDEEPSAVNLNTRVTAKTRMDALRFCQLACQMDDLCGSFSVCSRPAGDGMKQADCVLSPVRLTADRLNQIMSVSEHSVFGKLACNLTVGTESQMLILHREGSCSLHPKDFLAEYRLDKVWSTYKKSPLEEAQDEGDKSELEKRYLDLEDCAGLNFELDEFADPGNSTFTYCPQNSHCIVHGDDFHSLVKSSSEYCYIYKRHATRTYNIDGSTHLVATKLDSTSSHRPETPLDKEAKDEAEAFMEKLDLLGTYSKSQSRQFATMNWGSSVQKCARDCNMHKSKCLAFDACRQDDRVLCVLYSIRSPLVKKSGRFPMLKQERESLAEYKVELHWSRVCDHYSLKPDFLEVRLNTMLADEQRGSALGANHERQQAINELEEKIERENRKQNDEILSSLIEDVKQSAKDEEVGNGRGGPSGNQLIHLLSLLIGLLLGAVGFAYRQQILGGVSNIHKTYRERRAPANDNLTDFVLTNQNVDSIRQEIIDL